MRRRFLSLALFALLIQATLPYLSATCPLYQAAGASAAHHAMADCPLMAAMAPVHHDAAPQDDGGKPSHDTHTLCPLCEVASPLHAFVVAGLIALPPPPSVADLSITFVSISRSLPQPQTSAFSARAPPLSI